MQSIHLPQRRIIMLTELKTDELKYCSLLDREDIVINGTRSQPVRWVANIPAQERENMWKLSGFATLGNVSECIWLIVDKRT